MTLKTKKITPQGVVCDRISFLQGPRGERTGWASRSRFTCVVANPLPLQKNCGGYPPLCYAERPASQIISQQQLHYLCSSQSIILTPPFDPPRRLFLLRTSAQNASILCPRFGVGSVKGALLRRTPYFADYFPTTTGLPAQQPIHYPYKKNCGGYLPPCYAEHPATQIISQQLQVYLRSSQSATIAKNS